MHGEKNTTSIGNEATPAPVVLARRERRRRLLAARLPGEIDFSVIGAPEDLVREDRDGHDTGRLIDDLDGLLNLSHNPRKDS